MSKIKKRAILVLLGCLLCLAICLQISAHWQRTHRFGIKLLSADSIQEIIQGKQSVAFEPNLLVFNGTHSCPYDKAGGRILLAQSVKKGNWTGTLTTTAPEQFEIYLLNDDLWQDKKTAIATNHRFQIYLVSENTYMTDSVVISGGPILSIFGTDDDSISRMQLWNPDSALPSQEFIESHCKFHVRGNTSTLLDKKSYKLELCDALGTQVKYNLLDMRKDDDWNLNSLYTDTSKIREKLGYSLWQIICDAENAPFQSTTVEYTEVVLNNQYHGLYGLMLPIDRKLFNMDDDDTAYTFKTYEIPSENDLINHRDLTTIWGAEQKIGLLNGNIAEGWDGFEHYSRLFLWQSEPASTSLDQIAETVNIDSILSYHLAVQVLGAQDNVLKNMHVLNYRQPHAPYQLYKTLWDINFSWGDGWVDGLELFTDTVIPTDWIAKNADYSYLLKIAPEETRQRTIQKWNLYRSIGIDPENLCRLADKYMQQLHSSGAMARDANRWPTSRNDSNAQEIKDWIMGRFDFLDAYYAS